MKWAVVTLSRQGLETALKVGEHFDSDIYTLGKYLDKDSYCESPAEKSRVKAIPGQFKDFNGYLFENYRTIVYIMASGIVVRDIAPYLKHKSVDPAVLVVDGKGEFVISLLSGHLGGANEKTLKLAEKIGAQAVITTMSDVMGKTAVDLIAMKLDCAIGSFEKAKDVTADIINDDLVSIVSDLDIIGKKLPVNIQVGNDAEAKSRIVVSNRRDVELLSDDALLIPRNIVLGLGCRRDTSFEKIDIFVKEELERNNINLKAIKRMASIDLKLDEKGLLEFSEKYNAKFLTYSSDDLVKYEDKFEVSEFVKRITGVGSVCETSGYIGSNFGKKISDKTAKNGMTLSIWEEKKCYTL
jgi:cobalt-precorrin 5A hydrolase